jgi:hypothetical protein
MSSPDDQFEEEWTGRNVTVHRGDRRKMVSGEIGGDRLQEVQSQGVEKALANHERVLCPLRRSRVVGHGVDPHGSNGNHAVVAEKVPGPSSAGESIDDGNIEKAVPAPDLRLGKDKVKEALEIRVIREIKGVRVQALSRPPEMFCTRGTGEVPKGRGGGQGRGKSEDNRGRYAAGGVSQLKGSGSSGCCGSSSLSHQNGFSGCCFGCQEGRRSGSFSYRNGFSGCCFLQGKDLSTRLSNEFVGSFGHTFGISVGAVAGSNDGDELQEAVWPERFLLKAAVGRVVKNR